MPTDSTTSSGGDGLAKPHPLHLDNTPNTSTPASERFPDHLTNSARPALAKQWQTERPHATARASSTLSPKLPRRATNISALNEAIWSSYTNDADDSSSSSSDDGNDSVLVTPKRGAKSRPRQQTNIKGSYSRFNVGNEDYSTKGKVSKKDGRLNITVNETNNRGYLAKALGANFLKDAEPSSVGQSARLNQTIDEPGTLSRSPSASSVASVISPPRLNIVVMVIGSRGDIQPFLKIGKNLKEYGHRVRIATHPAFKDFVEKDSGLEFFSVGGDPAELMAFMVKNPGMIPTMDTLKKGEVGRRREQMAEMFEGFWRACINATDDERDVRNLKMMGHNAPFIADAIISNPPSFAHIHCAERLGIPLHLMFTFPYTPTQAFPHPLANIKKTNVDPGYTNFMSYPLVEMMTWQGLGDLVNTFRVKTLGLEAVSTLWAPGQLYRLKVRIPDTYNQPFPMVPYTYLWSPGLVPKPKDWGPEIDIAGFVFLDLASTFEPPRGLVKFLESGETPVYIGFGSIVVDDPDKFTTLIFEAVKKAGVRALVSKGWGGLGDDKTPDNVYMLDNTPHDWLFPKVKAVVHHGGAGTTAIGLKCGKPTMVVPFFGDQQFWGAMIGEAGAGAYPVPYKNLTADNLADGILQLLSDKARYEAEKIARSIAAEGDGAKNAVTSFHRSLILRGQNSMRCSILEDRVAVWSLKDTHLRLSALAAELLVEKKKISWKDLRLIRHNEWNDFEGPGEPLTGGATALMGTITGVAAGVGSVPFKLIKTTKRHSRHQKQKRSKEQQAGTKRSGNGSHTIGNRRLSNRSSVSSKGRVATSGISKRHGQVDGHIGKIDQGDSDRGFDGSAKTSTADLKAPNQSDNRATAWPDMGKHNTQGEPMGHNKDANREDDDAAGAESELSDDYIHNTAKQIAQDVGTGLGKTAEALARAPMDLSLAVAQGFHNAPRLYGDTTVRRPARITGIKSGLKAAGKEFIWGVNDGVSGLVMQPYTGARDNGAFGLVKGIGMGLTGFVLKDLAAIFGPLGYTAKGLHKEALKGRQPTNFIRKARILQGQRDVNSLDDMAKRKTQETVNHGWSVVRQVSAVIDEERSQGLKARVSALKERKTWRTNGAFENVEMAEKALEARRKGESLGTVFAQQREELKKAQSPRLNVASEMEKAKLGDNGDMGHLKGKRHVLPAEHQSSEL